MKRYKMGYTTGVFDLFHIGHLNILERAKEECEYLIVGISTDELVMEYKNKKPIIPFAERMRIVEAIKYVDKVVPQKSLNKVEAYMRLKFDVLFQGDDWKNSPIYNETINQFKKIDAGGGGTNSLISLYKRNFLQCNSGIFEKNLKRDALFVGSDWKGTSSWDKYEQEFKEVSVDVVYIPYTNGTSSTLLQQVLNEVSKARDISND